jgi:succinoglycan biosynthesis transport protein ExoP
LSTLDEDITQSQAALAQANARVSELQNQVGMGAKTALAVSSLSESEGVQQGLTELQKIQAELAKQQTLYRAPHPAVTQLQRQEAAAKAVLQERVGQILGTRLQVPPGKLQIGKTGEELVADLAKAEVERFSAAQRLQALARSQAAYDARSKSLPALEKTQRELERQLDAAQTTYKTLLTKLQEVQVAENQNIGNASVVSAAEVPTQPKGLQTPIFLAAGGVVVLLLGAATAFLVDYADRSVKTLKEARELFNYALLGVIPTVGGGGKASDDQAIPRVITRDNPNFAAQEAYQMLHANLRFLASDKELKTIVITSSVRKEGKSTVAANLAAAMAQVQRRVLLVDADLRHPCQHHVWNLVNTSGLSNLIVGQVTFRDAVQVLTSHLHVLTAGAIPPNPIAILDSKRMTALIELFTQSYDFVIFDAPMLSGTADATVLNKMTDGSLLVVRPGTISTQDGTAAKQFLKQSSQTVLGIVVNHFDVRKEPDSYFYYKKEDPSDVQPRNENANV